MNQTDLMHLGWVRAALASGQARELRERAHLSQAEISRVIGTAPNAVSRWEAGRRTPRGEVGVRYAKFLQRLDGRS